MTKFVCKKCGELKMVVRGATGEEGTALLQCEKCYDCIHLSLGHIEWEKEPNYLEK